MVGHPAHLQPLTTFDTVLVAIVLAPIAALIVWGFLRVRQARRAIRGTLLEAGYEILRMQRRLFRSGPFFWTTTRGQIVYRVVARGAGGELRQGWARWGRNWLFRPDTLELRWDE